MRVLVADDESDVRMLCRVALEGRGHAILEARDGAEALELIRNQRLDLALVDVMLPRLDGFELLAELDGGEGADVPVVLVSARVGEDDQRRGLEAGAVAYLTKPFSPPALAGLVAQIGAMAPAGRDQLRSEALDRLERRGKGPAPLEPSPPLPPSTRPDADNLLASVVELALDAVVSVNEEQRIVGFNKGAETLFGYLAEEVLGKPLDILLPVSATAVHRLHVERFASGDEVARPMGERQEIFGRRRDGTEFPAEASIVKLETGNQRTFAAILRDATDRRVAEAELQTRAQQQAAVAALGQRALTGIEPSVLMAEAVETLVSVLDVEIAAILELDRGNRRLLPRAVTGSLAPLPSEAAIDAGERTLAAYALAAAEPTVVENLATDTRFDCPPFLRDRGITSGMCVAIRGPARAFGLLEVHVKVPRHFSSDDIHFVQAVANVLAAAVEREQTQERLLGFLEAAPDATFVVDGHGRIVSVNGRAEALFGYEREHLVGMLVDELVPDRARGSHASLRAGYAERARTRPMGAGLELWARRRDGSELAVDIMLSPIDSDEGPLVVAAVRDVSERRRAEFVRDSFLHAVSHELRTPLTSVVGFAQMLQDPEVTFSPDQAQEMLGRLLDNALRLERLLGDLLDLDRLARGVLEPQRRRVDVGSLLRAVVEQLDLGDHPVSITVEPEDLVADVDPAQTERIIENLLMNVSRHTPPETPAAVRASRGPNGLLLVIEDEGQGVSDELKATIFEPFQRGPTPQHAPGTGIGLSLVTRFAELHRGRAWVEDRVGGGASFRVVLADPGR